MDGQHLGKAVDRGPPGARLSTWPLMVGFSHYWQPFNPLMCFSTGKVGSEMLQAAGAGGLGEEAWQLSRGEAFW